MNFKKILMLFIGWRILLFIYLFLAIGILPLRLNFLGGGLENYLKNPLIWSWLNFDGEHYLSIAQRGYQDLEYFFFPTYPILLRTITEIFVLPFQTEISTINYVLSGLFISNLAFLIGLIGLVKLIKFDYEEDIAYLTVILILLFPASFYFGSFYSESLFFSLVVWSFYFARKKNWFYASLLAMIASATRLVGIVLLPSLFVEAFAKKKDFLDKKDLVKKIFFLSVVPLGLLAYMYFMKIKTGDPLVFLHLISIYGEQRSSKLVFLPRVFYRYIFKIIPAVDYSYFPVVFMTWLEFLTAILFGGLSLLGILGGLLPKLSLGELKKLAKQKIRLSWAIYLFLGYLVPTFSGSFSSLPRYAIVLFPAFFLMAIYLNKLKIFYFYKYVILSGMFFLLGCTTALFVRGYWIG